MHVHTVLVTLHDPATAERCRDVMSSMRGKIDGMIDLTVVTNELAGGYSADVALTTTWRDLAAYEAYTTDPVHLEVRAVVLDLMASAATIDYTLDEAVGDTATGGAT
jgi:quinol monooxygenase YgiN